MDDDVESGGSLFSVGRNTLFTASVVVLVAFAFLIWFLIRAVDYTPLYKNLSEGDAAEIAEFLRDEKVAFKIGEDGTSLLVDSTKVADVKLRITSSNVRIGDQSGFELFDNVDYGLSDFSEKLYYQRGLEGELARTISLMSGVKSARVHLVLKERGLFSREQTDSKAAVKLIHQDGYKFTRGDIRTIQHLVSSSVRGLSVADVFVSDESGKIFVALGDDAFGSAGFERKQEVEQYLTSKAYGILFDVFGSGNFRVNIDVTLDSVEAETMLEKPVGAESGSSEGVLVEKRETSKANKLDNGSGKKNQLGKEQLVSTTESKFVIGKYVKKEMEAAGGIQRLSVSIVVPKATKEGSKKAVADLVAAAIGLDAKRGDVVVVEGLLNDVVVSDEPLIVSGSLEARVKSGDEYDSQSESSESLNSGLLEYLSGGNYMFFIVFATCALLLMIAVSTLRGAGSSRRETLTKSQRQKLLEEIQDWLKDGAVRESTK